MIHCHRLDWLVYNIDSNYWGCTTERDGQLFVPFQSSEVGQTCVKYLMYHCITKSSCHHCIALIVQNVCQICLIAPEFLSVCVNQCESNWLRQ